MKASISDGSCSAAVSYFGRSLCIALPDDGDTEIFGQPRAMDQFEALQVAADRLDLRFVLVVLFRRAAIAEIDLGAPAEFADEARQLIRLHHPVQLVIGRKQKRDVVLLIAQHIERRLPLTQIDDLELRLAIPQ